MGRKNKKKDKRKVDEPAPVRETPLEQAQSTGERHLEHPAQTSQESSNAIQEFSQAVNAAASVALSSTPSDEPAPQIPLGPVRPAGQLSIFSDLRPKPGGPITPHNSLMAFPIGLQAGGPLTPHNSLALPSGLEPGGPITPQNSMVTVLSGPSTPHNLPIDESPNELIDLDVASSPEKQRGSLCHNSSDGGVTPRNSLATIKPGSPIACIPMGSFDTSLTTRRADFRASGPTSQNSLVLKKSEDTPTPRNSLASPEDGGGLTPHNSLASFSTMRPGGPLTPQNSVAQYGPTPRNSTAFARSGGAITPHNSFVQSSEEYGGPTPRNSLAPLPPSSLHILQRGRARANSVDGLTEALTLRRAGPATAHSRASDLTLSNAGGSDDNASPTPGPTPMPTPMTTPRLNTGMSFIPPALPALRKSSSAYPDSPPSDLAALRSAPMASLELSDSAARFFHSPGTLSGERELALLHSSPRRKKEDLFVSPRGARKSSGAGPDWTKKQVRILAGSPTACPPGTLQLRAKERAVPPGMPALPSQPGAPNANVPEEGSEEGEETEDPEDVPLGTRDDGQDEQGKDQPLLRPVASLPVGPEASPAARRLSFSKALSGTNAEGNDQAGQEGGVSDLVFALVFGALSAYTAYAIF